MKNATLYEKKVKKLLSGMPRVKASEAEDLVEALLEAILSAHAPRKAASSAIAQFNKEYVDYNELRVAPAKEIADYMGRDFPGAREKGETIVRVLNAAFDRTGTMTLDYMKEMAKKDLRRHLAEIGLSAYSAGCMMLALGHSAVPVDATLADALKMEEALPGDCTIEEAQAFLERAIAQKDVLAAHEFFRSYTEKNAKNIAKWRKANPEQATKAPVILPPPKFQMMAKSQPLPPMKGEEGDFSGGDVPDLDDAGDADEPVGDVDEIELPEDEGEEAAELPADEEHEAPAKPSGKGKSQPKPAPKAKPGRPASKKK